MSFGIRAGIFNKGDIGAVGAKGELPPADHPVPEAEELKRLRKEVRQLQLENEILKKTAAYFARDSL